MFDDEDKEDKKKEAEEHNLLMMVSPLQARIQLLAKEEVMKIMENNVLLPQEANVSDRMPRKRVPQPASLSFNGYTIDSECASWEPIGGICKPASWGGAPGSNHILSNIMASKRAKLRGLLS